jgi:hypothetical protein
VEISTCKPSFWARKKSWNSAKLSIQINHYEPEDWVATRHVGGWWIAGDMSLWQVCLWINRRPWTNSPTPRCYVWLTLIRAEGVNGAWVMCPNGASGKPGNIPDYVALHCHRELCQCRHLFLSYSWDKNGHDFFFLNWTRSSCHCRLVTVRTPCGGCTLEVFCCIFRWGETGCRYPNDRTANQETLWSAAEKAH